MKRPTVLCYPLAVLVWLSGNIGLRASVPTATAAPPCLRRGILYVVNGAGGFEVASRTICQTAAESNLPIEIRTVRWTHGNWRIAADQMDSTHLLREGRKLAEEILRCRQAAPHEPVFLLGHSAGCGVALAAAENLPPNTLTRIILLAPAVAATHDLRPALQSACLGIDVFMSSHDWACLGIGIFLAGTTDRCWLTPAAGKNGFEIAASGPEDVVLYRKLRQYAWQPGLKWTGHKGGHYGNYQPTFLRLFVFPLLASSLTSPER